MFLEFMIFIDGYAEDRRQFLRKLVIEDLLIFKVKSARLLLTIYQYINGI